MKIVWLFLAIFAIILLSSSAMYLFSEDFMIGISEEDKPIQNLNAALFLVSSLVGIYLYFKSSVHRKMLLFLSVVSLTGFLDELSFGARMFGWKMPMVMGTTFDAIHDLFYIGIKGVYKLTLNYPLIMAPLMFLGILLFTFILFTYRLRVKEITVRLYRNKPSFLLATFFIVILFLALVIDLDQIENEFLYLMEELLELSASIALFFLILSLQRVPARKTAPNHAVLSGHLNSGIIAAYIVWQVRVIRRFIKLRPKTLTRL